MNRRSYCLLILQIILSQFLNFVEAQPHVVISPFVSGFTRPVKVVHASDSRLFVAEIGGKVKIIKNGNILNTPFLDIASLINDPTWAGIFSITFAPNYQSSGHFYIMYVIKNSTAIQISRFSRSSGDADLADIGSEVKILTVPYEDILGGHRGGDLAFGKDGYLYISTGDNGPGSRGVTGDPQNNSQDPAKPFGKMLKVDINNANPATTVQILALGLRNPWRFSFDRTNGDLWIGDNGQDAWEEINYLSYPFGSQIANFGWNCKEGNDTYTSSHCTEGTVYTPPKHFYAGYLKSTPNTDASVMGGYVYRGSKYPSLEGYYFFGDYSSGKIGLISPAGVGSFPTSLSYASVISFGEDNAGELYVLSLVNGNLSKITNPNDPLPVTLESLTAIMENCTANLGWKTTSEVNFSHFIIQRSSDAHTFTDIKPVQSSGESADYRFSDEDCLPGSNYYRLKMIDRDGTFSYSKMIAVKNNCAQNQIFAFPNPVHDKLTIEGLKPGNRVNIYNNSGVLVIAKEAFATKLEINLKDFPGGIYTLNVAGTDVVQKLRLVK